MTFKSRQRAKHSHLFGEDTVNATTKTGTPTTTKSTDTLASKPKHATSPLDTLSRSSSPGTSNNDKDTNSSPLNGSIFGGVDVSKFNSGRSTTCITLLNPTLKAADDDLSDTNAHDYLFGGSRKSTASTQVETRKSTTSSTMTAMATPTGSLRASIPLLPSNNSAVVQHTRSSSTSSMDSYSQTKQHTNAPPRTYQVPPPSPPARSPPAISKSVISPLVSSSTSPIVSASSSRSSSPITVKPQQVPPPPSPRIHKNHQQDLLKPIEASMVENTVNRNSISNDNNINKQMMEQQKSAMMEDEATQAFAMEPTTSSLIPDLSTMRMDYDDDDADSELYASVTQCHPSITTITGSSSTPITHYKIFGADNQPILPITSISHTNPWHTSFFSTSIPPLSSSIIQSITTTTTPIIPLPSFSTTASAKKQRDLDKKLKEMEPAKRAAFADLIADWHGSHHHHQKHNNNDNNDNNDQFLRYVASEKRDIGFAGINGQVVSSNDSNGTPSFGWHQGGSMQDNPWT